MKSFLLLIYVALLFTATAQAQIKNAKTTTLKVFGNCGMCKTTIEKAGSKKRLYKTEWNEETKMATITYDSKKSSADEVMKNIALSGYDNVNYLAPDNVYSKLHGCCKYDREQKTEAVTEAKSMTDGAATMQDHGNQMQANNTMNMNETTQLKAVYDNYFLLKDALVKTDGALASTKGADLLTALNMVEMGKLNTEEHTVWMQVEKALKTDAKRIKESSDIDNQRENFITLSKMMYELVKAGKPAETVYYQFCPMANDGKGANWLSKESAIKNPYYGSQMLTCGKIIETIKQ